MDRKILTIVLAATLIASFFLPYYHPSGEGKGFSGSFSGIDIISAKWGDWERYLILLIPISGLLLLISELNKNYFIDRRLLCWLPLLVLVFWIIIYPLLEGFPKELVFNGIGKNYGIGLWLTIAVSFLFVVSLLLFPGIGKTMNSAEYTRNGIILFVIGVALVLVATTMKKVLSFEGGDDELLENNLKPALQYIGIALLATGGIMFANGFTKKK